MADILLPVPDWTEFFDFIPKIPLKEVTAAIEADCLVRSGIETQGKNDIVFPPITKALVELIEK